VKTCARSLNALRSAPRAPFASRSASASRLSGVSGPGSNNTSIERTNNGGRFCAASAAVCAPLFAAHVERYASAQPASQFACVLRAAGLRAESSRQRVAAQMNLRAPCSLASRSQQSGALACASFLSLRGSRGSGRNGGRGSRHAQSPAALNALHPSTPALVRSGCGSGTCHKSAFNPGSHNTSIERTNNGGQRLSASAAWSAPLFAAHVER
jgi:hypothetical protein